MKTFAEAKMNVENPAAQHADSRPMILVIDDDAGLRDSLTVVLEAFGFRIVTAEDGEAGFSMMNQMQPSVVVTDLHMPNLDGFGVMNRMRHAGLTIPTIVISGGGSSRRQNGLLDCASRFGAIATFEKPFSPLELIDTINRLPAFSGRSH